MIVGGAISAARAKSDDPPYCHSESQAMAWLSLILFFGAPDLAMTQFSVETLTAVIFVLVFYHFRGFEIAVAIARPRSRHARRAPGRRSRSQSCCCSSRHRKHRSVWPIYFAAHGRAARLRPQHRERYSCRFSFPRYNGRDYSAGNRGNRSPGGFRLGHRDRSDA